MKDLEKDNCKLSEDINGFEPFASGSIDSESIDKNKMEELIKQVLKGMEACKIEAYAYVGFLNSFPKEERDHQRRIIARTEPFMTVKLLRLMERMVTGKIDWDKYWESSELVWFLHQRSQRKLLEEELAPFYMDAFELCEKEAPCSQTVYADLKNEVANV